MVPQRFQGSNLKLTSFFAVSSPRSRNLDLRRCSEHMMKYIYNSQKYAMNWNYHCCCYIRIVKKQD